MPLDQSYPIAFRTQCVGERKNRIINDGVVPILMRHRRLLRRGMRGELMETSQILFYAILALVLFLYVRRMLFLRSLTKYSPSEVAEKLKQGGIVLLDVRTADERSLSAIKGSLHIPLHELRRRADELQKYKNTEIVCYCATGSRSASAAATLTKLGFKAANMKGGIAEWKFSGLK